MAIKTYTKKSGIKLSESFNSSEFDCKCDGCCCETLIDDKLIDFVQNIRNHFGSRITITSGYRCPVHNRSIGGATASQHKIGQAADIVVEGVNPCEVAKYAESIGVKGIGLYESNEDGHFVHIDTRLVKYFWYGQAQARRDTFGGAPVTISSSSGLIKQWQNAAVADCYKFPWYGADGSWGSECEAVAEKAICRKCLMGFKNKNLTKIVQGIVGVEADGLFGNGTRNAVIIWQRNNGLTADGVVGYKTWKVMLGI
jgi:hypothetical protein